MPGQKVLLLNASNFDTYPVYPYAFIQVPAVATRMGIEVVCKDLLGIPQERRQQTVQTLINQHNPGMILITLRNTDSLSAQDYEPDDLKEGDGSAYFPIERTRELIATIRALSDLKIAVGGFGFSLLPEALMHYLRPDFGVVDGPDDFFAHFEDIKNGKPDRAANLLFFQEDQLISNPRREYPPLDDAEYNPQVIEAMLEFYAAFPSPGFQGAAVEIMRGCSHSCVFCAEPHSKGAQVRYRNLSAVMKDLKILADNGITRIYLVSSELNPEGNEFILDLADRIRLFNKAQTDDRKISWYGANYLLTFEHDDYERLYKSGFTGGWFDITALDDENAHAMRTPYRNAHLLARLKAYIEHQEKQNALRRLQKALGSEVKFEGDIKGDESIRWTMFLGNPATNAETIRNTLQIAHREGFSNSFDSCSVINNTRVFDYEALEEAALAATYSVTLDLKRTAYQQLLPSFVFPPALLQDFSEKEICDMFNHIADTYLSKKYQQTRDWRGFVNQATTPEAISRWMAKLSNIQAANEPAQMGQTSEGSSASHKPFAEETQKGEKHSDANQAAKEDVDFLVLACLESFPGFFESLGLPDTAEKLDRTTPYELALALFNRWETAEDLLAQTQAILPEWNRDLLQFCVQAILYRFNILINPRYRQFFI